MQCILCQAQRDVLATALPVLSNVLKDTQASEIPVGGQVTSTPCGFYSMHPYIIQRSCTLDNAGERDDCAAVAYHPGTAVSR
jgi:hypothetical protein